MNRRRFFRRALGAAVVGVAALYCPSVLRPIEPRKLTVTWALDYCDVEVMVEQMAEQGAEQIRRGIDREIADALRSGSMKGYLY